MVSKEVKWDSRYLSDVAVKKGFLIKPEQCEKCSKKSEGIEKHHPDYTTPLVVRWLCISCHRKIHAGRKKQTCVKDNKDSYFRNVRKEKGLSLRDAARGIGITRQGLKLIEDWITRRPSLKTMHNIAIFYGLDIEKTVGLFPAKQRWVNRRKPKKTVCMKSKEVKIKLIRIDRRRLWLARQINVSPADLSSYLKGRALSMELSKAISSVLKGDWEDYFYINKNL